MPEGQATARGTGECGGRTVERFNDRMREGQPAEVAIL